MVAPYYINQTLAPAAFGYSSGTGACFSAQIEDSIPCFGPAALPAPSTTPLTLLSTPLNFGSVLFSLPQNGYILNGVCLADSSFGIFTLIIKIHNTDTTFVISQDVDTYLSGPGIAIFNASFACTTNGYTTVEVQIVSNGKNASSSDYNFYFLEPMTLSSINSDLAMLKNMKPSISTKLIKRNNNKLKK
jgi:hypothetical protein